MKSIGFVISKKNNEKRRALLPADIVKDVKNKKQLYFEKGYGKSVGVSDEDYEKIGCKVVGREKALACDIITDVKLGDADYFDSINDGKLLFGWAHAVQNIPFTTAVINGKHSVLAWEEIYEEGRYIFYRNREIAGEAAIMHAFIHYGKMPYDCKVAILGNGQTARGALRILYSLGANVDVYNRRQEKLFRKNMFDYDVLVNCILWDTSRNDRIIYEEDVKKMKDGTMIIDVSCDPQLEIETSIPTTIDDPVYVKHGVLHYAVDNTPAMFPLTVTNVLSEGLAKYIDYLVMSDSQKIPKALSSAVVIEEGKILDENIIEFRKKKGILLD